MQLERSYLSVPASNWHMIEKATTLDADMAFLDLEDGVAPAMKQEARQTVIRAFRDLDWRGRTRGFRVNALDTPYFYRDVIDVCEAVGEMVDAIILPKVHRPEDVHVLATLLHQIELARGLDQTIRIQAQIESAEGLLNAAQIARASNRIEALVLGPGDLAASLGMPVTSIGGRDAWDQASPGDRWHVAMSTVVIAARASGVGAIDGPLADFRDEAGLTAAARRARALGYDGKWCIHPSQIAVVNEIFTPTDSETAWARRVVEAYEQSTSVRLGATVVDGVMIDAASIRMARRVLDRSDAART